MSLYLILATIGVAATATLLFSTLTYSLRDLSRVRLAEYLERHNATRWLEPTVDHVDDLIFVTAVSRMLANTLLVLASLWLCNRLIHQMIRADLAAFALAAILTLFFSVAIPNALATHAGDNIIGACAPLLNLLRVALMPVTRIMHVTDTLVRDAVGAPEVPEPEHLEQEILSVVEEGEKDGIVDEQEREMIESVIQFRDTTAAQIMTSRPEIVGLPLDATLTHIRQTIEESGHSRIPVYDGTLDHIVGILYARDLLKYLGQSTLKFDIRSAMRPAFYIPEHKPLRDLLQDFRLQKVHIAVVLDEYGGTAGLVSIEDILEELVGDISDEHERVEPAMFKRLDEQTFEADARIYIDELNRLTGLDLPEDAGYDTLGGFVSTAFGRIPEPGAVFEQNGIRYTILDAEPQRIKRVKIEQPLQPPQDALAGTAAESAAPDA